MSNISPRDFLIEKGFKPGKRGRFSKEMIKALKESGVIFDRPVKDPIERSKGTTVPLV